MSINEIPEWHNYFDYTFKNYRYGEQLYIVTGNYIPNFISITNLSFCFKKIVP